MLHGEITTLDLIIVGLYLIAMVSIGVYFVRRIQNTEDYYVADHSFGPLVLMATVCATIIGGSGLMGRAGKAYSGGFMAIMTALSGGAISVLGSPASPAASPTWASAIRSRRSPSSLTAASESPQS